MGSSTLKVPPEPPIAFHPSPRRRWRQKQWERRFVCAILMCSGVTASACELPSAKLQHKSALVLTEEHTVYTDADGIRCEVRLDTNREIRRAGKPNEHTKLVPAETYIHAEPWMKDSRVSVPLANPSQRGSLDPFLAWRIDTFSAAQKNHPILYRAPNTLFRLLQDGELAGYASTFIENQEGEVNYHQRSSLVLLMEFRPRSTNSGEGHPSKKADEEAERLFECVHRAIFQSNLLKKRATRLILYAQRGKEDFWLARTKGEKYKIVEKTSRDHRWLGPQRKALLRGYQAQPLPHSLDARPQDARPLDKGHTTFIFGDQCGAGQKGARFDGNPLKLNFVGIGSLAEVFEHPNDPDQILVFRKDVREDFRDKQVALNEVKKLGWKIVAPYQQEDVRADHAVRCMQNERYRAQSKDRHYHAELARLNEDEAQDAREETYHMMRLLQENKPPPTDLALALTLDGKLRVADTSGPFGAQRNRGVVYNNLSTVYGDAMRLVCQSAKCLGAPDAKLVPCSGVMDAPWKCGNAQPSCAQTQAGPTMLHAEPEL